jgi:hypothetical protein
MEGCRAVKRDLGETIETRVIPIAIIGDDRVGDQYYTIRCL